MQKKTIEAIQAQIESDVDMQEYFAAYDDIVNLKWELPPGWETKDYIRKRISTEGHDAIKSLENLFDTHNPKLELLPRGEADRSASEELERWAEWQMKRANQIGEKSPFRKALHNAGKYGRVILQVDYLPYWLPANENNWTKEQRMAAKQSPFCITVHNPRTVYYGMGKYGLKWIAAVTILDAQKIIDHWSIYEGDEKEGKKVKSALSKIKKDLDEDAEAKYIHVDYLSYERREVACFKANDLDEFTDLDPEAEHISIIDVENELGFLNWTVVTGESEPLLHSMHISGAWENQCLIETIVDSTILRRAFFPILKHTSLTGKQMDIDYDGTQDVVELQQGENAEVLMPPPIDPGLSQLAATNSNRLGMTVGIKNLQSMEMAGNVQYSTMNAYIQLQMSALEPFKRTVEKAWEQAAIIMFEWVKSTGDKVSGYRNKVKAEGQFKGQEIVVGPESFNTEDLFITCELIPNTPTDKMQLVNMYTSLKQAGAQIAWGELLERLGMGTPEVLKQDWMQELMENTAVQNFVEELKAQVQLKVQAAQTQMQMALQMQQQQAQMEQQAQQAQMQQEQAMQQQAMSPEQAGAMGNPPTGDQVMPEGQMNNPAMGGTPPMMSAAGMTRNQVQGGQ